MRTLKSIGFVLGLCAGALLASCGGNGPSSSALPATRVKHVKKHSYGRQLLYVANADSFAITVYDEQGNPVTLPGSFPGLSYPVGLFFDAHNQLIYVGNSLYHGGSYITAYDTNGEQQTLQPGAFPNLGDPYGIAYDPATSYLYVTNYQELSGAYGGITVYDESGNEKSLSGSFFGAYQTNMVVYDPENELLYNTNYGCCGQALVTAYDQNGTLQTLPGSWGGLLPSGPYGIMYNPSNGFIYVAEANQNLILAFDQNGNPQTLSGSWAGLNGPTGLSYDPNNGYIYVANAGNGNSSITAYDNNGNQQTLSGSFPGLDYANTVIVVPAYTTKYRKHLGPPRVSQTARATFR